MTVAFAIRSTFFPGYGVDSCRNFIEFYLMVKSSPPEQQKKNQCHFTWFLKPFLLPYHEHIKIVNGADIEWRLNAGWNLHTHLYTQKKDHKSSATSRYHKLSAPMPFINRFSLQY